MSKNIRIIHVQGGQVLVSYATPVAFISALGEKFRTASYFSVTTSRHINQFLGTKDGQEKPQAFFNELLSGVLR